MLLSAMSFANADHVESTFWGLGRLPSERLAPLHAVHRLVTHFFFGRLRRSDFRELELMIAKENGVFQRPNTPCPNDSVFFSLFILTVSEMKFIANTVLTVNALVAVHSLHALNLHLVV